MVSWGKEAFSEAVRGQNRTEAPQDPKPAIRTSHLKMSKDRVTALYISIFQREKKNYKWRAITALILANRVQTPGKSLSSWIQPSASTPLLRFSATNQNCSPMTLLLEDIKAVPLNTSPSPQSWPADTSSVFYKLQFWHQGRELEDGTSKHKTRFHSPHLGKKVSKCHLTWAHACISHLWRMIPCPRGAMHQAPGSRWCRQVGKHDTRGKARKEAEVLNGKGETRFWCGWRG